MHQALEPRYFQNRTDFAKWILIKREENPGFVNKAGSTKVLTIKYASDKFLKNSSVNVLKPPENQHFGEGNAPHDLLNAAGTVSMLLMLCGFIDLAHLHRASIFLDERLFNKNRHNDLTKSWLKVGDRIVLDAV
ncbi:hypothetical protein HPB50_010300 [Hyalomma asiaticum]|uniref:Uncharacterized protein n=1 Tax=Hyalomma asiaticum TaxID=266040 RepID=A0ACB7TG01_HYAAI|nr:hypothetical protein HPB50_010300 [Hyalomma asiaticum]